MPRLIVIGLGNDFRHDDAAGLIAVRRLRGALQARGVEAEEHEGGLASLIERWNGADVVILLDAVSSGSAPGTIHDLDVSKSPLPGELFKGSTHAFGLADAVELSRTLGTLPPNAFVVGIEARDMTSGIGLSLEVERALSALMETVLWQVDCQRQSGTKEDI